MTNPIRVMIADDHTMFREGLRKLLESVPGFELVGEAKWLHDKSPNHPLNPTNLRLSPGDSGAAMEG